MRAPGASSAFRTGRAAFLAAVLGALAIARAAHAAGPYAYVGDVLSRRLWVVDLGAQAVVKILPIGFLSGQSVYNPSNGYVYIAAQENFHTPGIVTVIDTASNTVVASIEVGEDATSLALNPAGTLLYVAAGDPIPGHHKAVLWVIDTSTNTVLGTVDPGGGSNLPEFDPGTGLLWVGLGSNGVPGVITIKDPARNFATVADIPDLGLVSGLTFDSAKSLLYVADQANRVVVINTQAKAVMRTIPTAVGLHTTAGDPLSLNPRQVVRNSAGTRLWVLNSPVNTGCIDLGCPDRISVVDPVANAEIYQISFGTFETESHANGIALDPTETLLYVTRQINCGPFTTCGAITAIDTTTQQPVFTIDLGVGFPGAITVPPPSPPRVRCPVGNRITKPDAMYSVAAGVVTDPKTGLIWKQCSEGQSGTGCSGAATASSWSAALTAASTSSFGGFSDWRLPNEKELESLLEYGCVLPSINTTVFPGTASAPYWSSTTATEWFAKAWYVDFSGAINANFTGFKASTSNYVRLVRGGRSFGAFDKTAPSSPAPFGFASQTGVPLGSAVTSNTIVVSGLANPAGISVSGGNNAQYSVGGGPFVSSPGIVQNGDSVAVRQTSSTLGSATTIVTLTIGGVSGMFSVTTSAGTFVPPSQLAIASVNGGSHPKAGVGSAQLPFPVVVQSRDGSGNPANAAADTFVALSLSAGTGSLGGGLACTILAGTSSCLLPAVTYSQAEPGVVLTATRVSGDALSPGSSAPFTVDPSGLRLVFVQPPTTTAPGQPIAPSVTVRLVDGFGTPVHAAVPVGMSLSAGTGTLSGTLAGVTDTQGLAAFLDLSIDTAGSKQLTAASAGIASAVSGTFPITASTSPTQVAFAQAPSTTAAGQPIVPPVRVQLGNGAGNAIAWSGVTVTLSLSSGTGTLSGTLSRPTDGSGIATFSDLSIAAAGSKQLTAASGGLASAVSGAFSITVANSVTSAALAVDAAGNGMLEPGESLVVSPSWHNATGAPVNLTGVATSFGGPGGATYSIPDAAASYGSVAGGATASCVSTADCYTLLLSNPLVRPQTHWDAHLSESVSSGDAKTWVLHVGKSFTDVPAASGQYRFVETMLHKGITAGCGGASFCPGSSVTRAQMAVFLLVAKDGSSYVPPAATGIFADVPAGNGFAKWIEELFHRGVTAGCGGGNYCPGGPVTRAQMAVFLLVTKDGSSYVPPPATGIFADVPASNGFAKWVEELFHRGITAGCGGGNYCPNAGVTRGQMAVFLSTSFALSLYGP